MTTETCHINLGGNLTGSRRAIQAAIDEIAESPLVEALRCSRFYETEPWGFKTPNKFVNIGAEFETDLDPRHLLAFLLEVEEHHNQGIPHRAPNGLYADRLVDIDLIYYGQLSVYYPASVVMESDGTTRRLPAVALPHPRMHLRRFVLDPLVEMSPDWHHPSQGLTATQLLSRLLR